MPVDEYRLLLAVRVIKEFAWNVKHFADFCHSSMKESVPEMLECLGGEEGRNCLSA
jgi:hypothetical protein